MTVGNKVDKSQGRLGVGQGYVQAGADQPTWTPGKFPVGRSLFGPVRTLLGRYIRLKQLLNFFKTKNINLRGPYLNFKNLKTISLKKMNKFSQKTYILIFTPKRFCFLTAFGLSLPFFLNSFFCWFGWLFFAGICGLS